MYMYLTRVINVLFSLTQHNKIATNVPSYSYQLYS